MGEASLDGIEEVRASAIYPKQQLISEDSSQNVPYLPLPGESPHYIGCTTDGVIVLSNYRLYLSADTIFNIPLGLIEQVECRDIFYLYIYCKDARSFRCTFPNNEQCQKWFKLIQEAISLPTKLEKFFSFVFCLWSRDEHKEDIFTQLDHLSDDSVSDTCSEAERMGFNFKYIWKISKINKDYALCPSYPQQIIVPMSIPDDQLEIVANFRYSRRIPAVVWRHQQNGCVIARCSQPQVGWLGWRKQEDENLIQAIADACLMDPGLEHKSPEFQDSLSMKSELDEEVSMLPRAQPQCNDLEKRKLLIVDARSYAAAVANRWKGGGWEWPDYYPHCEVQFLGLANIHSIRKSFAILRTLCISTPDQLNWLSSLENSKWLQHITSLIRAALVVVNAVDVEKRPVLVHCSDGWDRTPQIVALAELLMDPFYRTKKGFEVLVKREWLEFGHKFADRCGNSVGCEDLNERSPVFLQWLDCVHQIHKQFPCHFEFNRQYLVKLVHHTYSCLFGTFLCNTCQERHANRVYCRTFSVWPFLNENTSLHNYLFNNSTEVLRPSYQAKDIRFWKEVYSPSYSVPLTKMTIPVCEEPLTEETPPEGVPLVKTKSFDDISSIDHPCERHRRNSDPNIGEIACFSENNQLPLKTETENNVPLELELKSQIPNDDVTLQVSSSSSDEIIFENDDDSERTEPKKNDPSNLSCKELAIDGSTDTLVSESGVIQTETNQEHEGMTSQFEELVPYEKLTCSVSTSTTDLTKDSNDNERMVSNVDVFDHKRFLCYQTVLQALRKQVNGSSSSCSYATPRHSRTPSSGFPATPCDDADVSVSKGRALPHQALDIDGSVIITEEIQEQIQKLIRHYKRKVKHLENDLWAAHTHFLHQVCHRCQGKDGINLDSDDDNASLSDSVCSGEQHIESSAGSDMSWETLEKPNPTLWVPDHAASCCTGCEVRFWAGKRKHHCRKCGQVFCSNCSNRMMPVPMEQLFHPVRVCNLCFEELQPHCRQSVMSCDKMPKAVITAASN